MPKLPRTISQTRLSTRAASPQGSMSAATARGRGLSELGGQISGIAEQWQKAVDFSQYLTAKNNLDTEITELTLQARDEPDYNASESYVKKIQKLNEKYSKGISSRPAQERFDAYSQQKQQAAIASVKGLFRGKFIEHTRAELIRSKQKNLIAYKNSPLENFDRGQFFTEYINDVKNNKGVVTEEDIVAAEQDIYNWEEKKVLFEAGIDRRGARQTTRDVLEGKYVLTQEQKSDLLKKLKNMETRQDIEIDIQKQLNQNNFDAEMYNLHEKGELTQSAIDQAKQKYPFAKEGTWDNLAASSGALSTTGVPGEYSSIMKEFLDITGNMVKASELKKKDFGKRDISKLLQLRAKVNDSKANGKISEENYKQVIGYLKDATENNPKFWKMQGNAYEKYRAAQNLTKEIIRNYNNYNFEKVPKERLEQLKNMGLDLEDEKALQEEITSAVLGSMRTQWGRLFVEMATTAGALPMIKGMDAYREIEKNSQQILSSYSEAIAKQLYDISENDQGETFVTMNGADYKVVGYSGGVPRIQANKENIDAVAGD